MEIIGIINTAKELLNTGTSLNEESTKMYLILPFISYLGYEVFSPEEVVYEYECDMHENGSRRVDCAILDDHHSPLILVEAKALGEDLDKHWGQTKSYLISSVAQYAILTNGNKYVIFAREQIDRNFYVAPPLFSFILTDLMTDDFDVIRRLAKVNTKPICKIVQPNIASPESDRATHPVVQVKARRISRKNQSTLLDFLQQEPTVIGKSVNTVYLHYCSFMAANRSRTVAKNEFIRQVCEKLGVQSQTKSGDSYFVEEDTITNLFADFLASQKTEAFIGKAVPVMYEEYLAYSQSRDSVRVSLGEFKNRVTSAIGVQITQKGGTDYFVREDTHREIIGQFISDVTLPDIINHSCTEVYQRYASFCRQHNLCYVSQHKFCEEIINMYPSLKISIKGSKGISVSIFADTTPQVTDEKQTDSAEMLKRIRLTTDYLERLLPDSWERMNVEERIEWLASDAMGTKLRKTVCNIEIWVEAWGEKQEHFNRYAGTEVKAVMKRIPNWIRSKDGASHSTNYGKQRYYVRVK